MSRLPNTLVDRIAQSCVDLYNKLPKTGKPVEKEWTVLSCIVKYDSLGGNYEVVSLGTGSKCVGATKMSSLGDVLNDSHAEVLARRGFLLYLYDNIDKAIENYESIFVYAEGMFRLRDNVSFIFYSSQLPCGDASIIPKTGETDQFGEVLHSKKRQAQDDICATSNKKLKADVDIHRTGAKCLPDSEQDPKLSGTEYHLLGQVRTKPGRGDQTLSVSCSDKMARWIHIGVQGALLDLLCGPIYINHFVFGGGVPYSEDTLCRALLQRNSSISLVKCVPEFYQSSLAFPFIRTETNIRPAAGSIVWRNTKDLMVEVAVQGKRLGIIKKKAHSPNSFLCISKYKLYERFCSILQKHKDLKNSILEDASVENMPYNEMKRKSKRYLENWLVVKDKIFKTWTVKPDLWNFSLNIT